jgi:hypothetical protein
MKYSGEQWTVSKTGAGLVLRATTARHELHKGRVLLVKPNVAGKRNTHTHKPNGEVLTTTVVDCQLGEVWECSRDGKDTPLAVIDCSPDVFTKASTEVEKA